MAKMNRSSSERPTVGLFIAYTDSYSLGIWKGAAEKAKEKDVNLISFCGRPLHDPRDYETQNNIIYSLAESERLDGLLIPVTAIGTFISKEEITNFCQHFSSIPIICIGDIVEEIPCIIVENKKGLQDLISHLITDHNRKRIAFINGPETHPEAIIRYQVYRDVLAQCNLSFEPNLMAPGRFRPASGSDAITLLLDERRESFDAIVAANDDMAWGAMQALQKRGISVPEDVAVIGFDDMPKGKDIIPPLSTVKQPLTEMGEHALAMLIQQIQGEDVPSLTTLPTQAVIRESCGCLPLNLTQAKANKHTLQTEKQDGSQNLEQGFMHLRKSIFIDIKQTAQLFPEQTPEKYVRTQSRMILDSFIKELKKEETETFIPTLCKILRQLVIIGGDIQPWQNTLTLMHSQVLLLIKDPAALHRAEDLFQQARVLIGEMARQAQSYKLLHIEEQAKRVRELSQVLSTSFDATELINILENWLPLLQIPICYLALYNKQNGDCQDLEAPEWSQILMAYYQGKRLDLKLKDRLFKSRQLIPSELLPSKSRFGLLAMPLYFQKNHIGFIILAADPQETQVYDVLRGEMSSALQGSLFVDELGKHREHLEELVTKRSAELADERTKAILREKEHLVSLGHLIGGIAHNLRTPIMSLAGGFEGLIQLIDEYDRSIDTPSVTPQDHHEIAADMHHWINKMRPYCTYMSDIITTIKEHSTVNKSSQATYFTVHELINKITILNSQELRKNECTLEFHTHIDNEYKINGNITDLIQVINNLIINAQEAYTDTGGRIDLSIAEKHDAVEIAVTDYGQGIPEEVKKRIFNEMITTKGTKGTGLGLYTSKSRIFSSFHGTMSLDSTLGKGTTMRIRIPKKHVA